ncbi:MAG: hypothetical protein UHN47_14075, partial [Lachnospiraceae bacterium]|nr:hypothetical protein [Lachnospiraceae bacterium]
VMLFVVNLLYQRVGAIFMSIHQFVKLFCLNYQAYSPTLLVGKLSKVLKDLSDRVSVMILCQRILWNKKSVLR